MKPSFTLIRTGIFAVSILLVSLSTYAQVKDINTVAGNGTAGYSGDGGTATAAELNTAVGVAVDDSGNIYIADAANNRIRKVNILGIISTVAGGGFGGGGGGNGDGGAATAARLNHPEGVAIDNAGNIYIADEGNNRIRKVTFTTGIITTIAGTFMRGYNGDGIAATTAELNGPAAVTLDSLDNIYIADEGNERIRKITVTSGLISTVAGNGTQGYNADGIAATTAELYDPTGVAADDSGNVYIADYQNNRIRKVSATSGLITTVAGNGVLGYNGNGIIATAAELANPYGVAVDHSGNIFIGDENNNLIRKVNIADTISAVVGNGTGGYSGDGGPATAAEISSPAGVAVDDSGNIYVADAGNSRIRAVYTAYPPLANFTANDSMGCINTTIQFTDKSFTNISNKPTSWSWTFTGGTPPTSIVENPSVVYATLGTYTVKLVVRNSAGKDSITKTNYITINPLPTVTVSPTSDTICSTTGVKLNSAGALTYTWTPAIGLSATTGSSVLAEPRFATTYTVTGTDVNGCTNTAVADLTVKTGIIVTATASSNPVCKGYPVTLTGKGGNGVTYAWEPSASLNTTTGSIVTATPTTNTTYILTGTDTTNGCTDTAFVDVSIYGASEFNYTVNGYRVTLTMDSISSCASAGFQWNFGNGLTNTESTDPAVTYTSDTGEYTICLRCDGDSTCPQCVNITVPGNYSGSSTGISQVKENNNYVTIYPNPTNRLFTIDLGDIPGNLKLEIYNIVGQQVYQSITTNNEEQVNLSGQPAGMYFIYLKSNETIEIGKVLITK